MPKHFKFFQMQIYMKFSTDRKKGCHPISKTEGWHPLSKIMFNIFIVETHGRVSLQ